MEKADGGNQLKRVTAHDGPLVRYARPRQEVSGNRRVYFVWRSDAEIICNRVHLIPVFGYRASCLGRVQG